MNFTQFNYECESFFIVARLVAVARLKINIYNFSFLFPFLYSIATVIKMLKISNSR